MKWQCALLQRWLPEYPDGDLPAWGKRWLESHVGQCAACRRELAKIREALAAVEAAPVADPGPEFWTEFSQDLHLKLAQAAQEVQAAASPPAPRRWRWPYLLGAPALAVLLLWVAGQLTGPGTLLQNQALVKRPAAPQMAAVARPAPAPATRGAAAPALETEQFANVSLDVGSTGPLEEVDVSGWDLDSELAGMTEQEKEAFLHKLHQRNKDGSCLEGLSLCSWG
jgi:hypothetical protein